MRVLPSGRQVFDTGRVLVGLCAEPRQQDQGSHAELIQRLMTTPVPRHWEPAPAVIDLKPSLCKRLAMLLRGFL